MPPQFHPLQVDERTGEPYLRLPAPHSNIIITPFRTSDIPPMVEIMNDPNIYRWLIAPPYPFLPAHAEWWLGYVQPGVDAVWKSLQESVDGPLTFFGLCPVNVIREQKEVGTDEFLGCADLKRHDFLDVVDVEERTRSKAVNDAKQVGDPSIIWSIGDYITPKAQGRGIMTAVVRTLLHEWGVPRMGIRHMLPSVFVENVGSKKVFEKNGFVCVKTVPDAIDFPAKGEFPGGKRSLHFLEWKADP